MPPWKPEPGFGKFLHERRLTDGGAGLQVGQVGRPLAEIQLADARADGPGTDKDDSPAARSDGMNLGRERRDPGAIQNALGIGEHVGADLHDDGARFGEELMAHRSHRTGGMIFAAAAPSRTNCTAMPASTKPSTRPRT